MYQIGLTGGIASGKSSVSRILAQLGAFIIDADQIAREIVVPGQAAWQEIVDHFGQNALQPDGSLNRRWLGGLVFRDEDQRKCLEAITHPAIRRKVEQQLAVARERGFSVAVLDVPLLLETDWGKMVDEVWVVYVDRQTQLRRLILRDGLTEEEALARIASQLSLEEKRKLADLVIDNSGDPQYTRQQVEMAWNRILAGAK